MKLGTEDKTKVYALAGLAVVGGYLFYANVLSDSSATPTPGQRPAGLPGAVPSLLAPSGSSAPAAQPPNLRRANPAATRKGDEFRPTLRSKRPEDRIDPATIDPTLRLDLLAKVQGVDLTGGARNVFQFSAPPPKAAAELKGPEPKVLPKGIYGPKTAEQASADAPKPPAPPPAPPPTPINLKYYGYVRSITQGGRNRAFFLDGEEILVAGEGEVVNKKYKVVRIDINSNIVVMQDVVSKKEQSIKLAEDAPGIG